uniref:Immunoglobulin domain-containing protein n=1 Tax=Amazona collaria TaxID=241587 RepID=A0A8B9F989_9PSIT
MVLPATPVLAFGECQGLCGLSKGDVRHPDAPQRSHTAASLAGTWLLVQKFRLPRPVLSVLPALEVVAGARVTFRCTITHPRAGCFLYLEGQDKAPDFIHKDQEDFNLPRVHKGNEGRYSCQCYSGAALVEWSGVSNSLDLVVKGERSPKLHLTLLFLHVPSGLPVNPLSLFSPAVPPGPCVCPGSPTSASSVPLGPPLPLWEGSFGLSAPLWGSPVSISSCPLQITPGATWCAWSWALLSWSCWGSSWLRTGTGSGAFGLRGEAVTALLPAPRAPCD